MSDYFGTPEPPAASGEWLPPAPPAAMPAWAGGEPPAPVPGPWPQRRPAPWLTALVGAVGGLLVASGVFGLLLKVAESGDGDSGPRFAGALAAAAVAGLVVAVPRAPGAAWRVAAITAAFSLAVVPMGFWLTASSDVSVRMMLALFVLAPTAVWAACFVLGGTKGHPVFLAGALAGVWLLLSVLALDTGGDRSTFGSGNGIQRSSATFTSQPQVSDSDLDGDGIPDEFDPDFSGDDDSSTFYSDQIDGSDDSVGESIDPTRFLPFFFGFGAGASATGVGVLALLFGAGYLAAAWFFDQRGMPGSATPFQAVGIIAMLTSLSTLSSDLQQGGSGFLAVLAGAALIWLGASAGRRLSAWLGVVLAVFGAAGIVDAVVDDSAAQAVLLLLAGAGVLFGADRLLPRDAPGEADDEPTSPTSPGDPWPLQP